MIGLDPQEERQLAELREVFQTTNTAGWQRIKNLMLQLVDDAHEDMVGNLSSDPMMYMRLQLRWQQREAMMRGVLDYIGNCDKQRKQILEEIAEREKPVEDIFRGGPERDAA
jgi:hypothetical protein